MKKRFNLKRLLSKRNKSGFTLIEVIIAMALLGILVTGVVMFASPILTMVSNNKKNAQANMLSESINTYIMGNIRSARIVEIFAGQNLDYIMEHGPDHVYPSEAGNITTLFSGGSSTYAAENEIRCMGMVWLDDDSATGAGRKKLMLVNCKVDKHLNILSYEKVFDDSLYSGLYPTLHIDTIKTASGATSENGYEIVSKVYMNPNCYNVLQNVREQSGPNFTGTTYVQCVNLSAAYTKKGQLYPPSPITTGSSEPGATAEMHELARQQQAIQHYYDWSAETNTASNGFYENGSQYFYTDTFIYYVVPK